MPTYPDSEIPAHSSEHDPYPVDLSRRKLGMGLGMSAVFTLASRPVLAQQCLAASAAASGNLSAPVTLSTCTGRTPAEWVALAESNFPESPNIPDNGYPVPAYSSLTAAEGGNIEFNTVFNSGSSKRLYEVMGGLGLMGGGTSPVTQSGEGGALSSASSDTSVTLNTTATTEQSDEISMEFAATLLNIRDGRVPDNVLTETRLIGMWNELLTSGVYSPMAGATWDATQVVAFLRTLQGA